MKLQSFNKNRLKEGKGVKFQASLFLSIVESMNYKHIDRHNYYKDSVSSIN